MIVVICRWSESWWVIHGDGMLKVVNMGCGGEWESSRYKNECSHSGDQGFGV